MKTYKFLQSAIIICILACWSFVFAKDVRVENIDFKGNDEISSGKLEKGIKTQANPWYRFFLFWKESKLFDEDTFLNDLLRIEKLYHKEGFLQAIVKDYDLDYNDKGDEVDITIHIREGEPTIVKKVEFAPSDGVSLPFEEEKLRGLLSLREGDRYREEELTMDYNRINEYFSNNSYPYIRSRVKPQIDNQEHTMVLEWLLEPGPESEFGEIEITGNKSVSKKLIRRGLGFREGQQFQQKKLVMAQSQIYQLELFQYVNLRATNLEQQPTAIPIQVEIKERNLRTLKFGVGYGTEEAFRMTANWRHRNFLGGARIFNAEVKHSTNILPLNVEIQLNQPFFFDNQNDLTIKPFFTWQDERSFEARRIGAEVIFNRQMTRRTNFFTTVRVERDTVRAKGADLDTVTIIGDELRDVQALYNKSVLSSGIRRNSTDQLFTPSQGSIITFVVEEAGLLFKSRFNYYKFYSEYKKYFDLGDNVVFAWRFFLGSMNPFGGSAATPLEERFYAGGSYSVRGWERQQLGPVRVDTTGRRTPEGGNSKFEGSLELRYPILGSFGGALFLDYGNVWGDWLGFDFLGLKYSIGTGLRYNTPIGPFRVDFAWKINKQAPEERNWQIHISIGQAF